MQFAREENYEKPVEGESKIIMEPDMRNPFLSLIIDISTQILLLERKSSFQNIDTTIRLLESYLGKEINKLPETSNTYFVTLREISQAKEFWSQLEPSKYIYSLELHFNRPNLFEGRFKANELINSVSNGTSFGDFIIKLTNKNGRLKILRDNFADYINLITSGGGSYKVKFALFKRGTNAKKITLDSRNNVESVELPDVSNVDSEEIKKKLKGLDELNEGGNPEKLT